MSDLNSNPQSFLGYDLEVWQTIIIPLILLILGWIGKMIHDLVTNNNDSQPIDINITMNDEELPHVALSKEGEASGNYRKTINTSIEQHLLDLKLDLDVDRAWLGRFHNNNKFTNYPSSDIWQVFSITNVQQDTNIIEIKNKLKYIPIILYKPILERIIREGYFYIDDIKKLPSSIHYLFKNLNISSIAIMGIFNENKKLNGIVGIEKTEGRINISQDVLATISKRANLIGNFIPLIKKINNE